MNIRMFNTYDQTYVVVTTNIERCVLNSVNQTFNKYMINR